MTGLVQVMVAGPRVHVYLYRKQCSKDIENLGGGGGKVKVLVTHPNACWIAAFTLHNLKAVPTEVGSVLIQGANARRSWSHRNTENIKSEAITENK